MPEMTLTEAAHRLGLSPKTIGEQVRRGKLRARRAGAIWLVTEREVERYRAVSLGRFQPGEDEAAAE